MPADVRSGIGILCCLLAPVASAHSQGSSNAFLQFADGAPSALQLELAPLDLLQEIDLDADADSRLTWSEVLAGRGRIYRLALDGVRIATGGETCRTRPAAESLSLLRRSDQVWVRLSLAVDCPATAGAGAYEFGDDMFFDADPGHRLLLRVTSGGDDSVYVLSSADRRARIVPRSSLAARAGGFVLEGFRHILSGYDHLAFLFLLVLPLAGRDRVRERLLRIAGIVSAFTVAHSITLAAAVLGLVRVPAQPVEIAIAVSVVLAAILNVAWPRHAWGWQAALAFGLLHGFGFAGALSALDLAGHAVWAALAGFNVGIELGQMLIVLVALPLLTLLSGSTKYRPVLVPTASLAFAALGVVWIVARVRT